jgi:predicted ATPase
MSPPSVRHRVHEHRSRPMRSRARRDGRYCGPGLGPRLRARIPQPSGQESSWALVRLARRIGGWVRFANGLAGRARLAELFWPSAIEDALVAHLRERRLLVVLDNCEHLLDACRQLVSAVVSRCDRVRILCTSRQRLGIAGEAVVALSALEVPALATKLPIAGLAEVEALRLLVDRAVAVALDFALTDESRGAASDICRRLNGLPLAIELAAVRLASLTADDLLERLDDRFRLPATNRSAESPRHRALRATVEWSHELLSDEERILWRRPSVFAGSVSVDAAEAVCSGAGLERDRVLDVIASLVDRSILTMGHAGRRGRYRLLETMRPYGAERLREAAEDSDLHRRHAEWYAQLVSADDRPWWGDS